jgi:hypothetical protein
LPGSIEVISFRYSVPFVDALTGRPHGHPSRSDGAIHNERPASTTNGFAALVIGLALCSPGAFMIWQSVHSVLLPLPAAARALCW